MRISRLAAAALTLAVLATPLDVLAWVVVRAPPVYVAPRPVVVVAPPPTVVVVPAPVYVAPAPASPPPPKSILTTSLPVGTNFMTLPNGCNAMTIYGKQYFQCGVNWMRPYQGPDGPYYSVVPPP